MSGKRQKTQYKQLLLAFAAEGRGETPDADRKGTEPLVAKRTPESPAEEERLMEEVCDRKNLEIAWKRVRGNKGSPGVDGMTIDETVDYLREHWPTIREQLLERNLHSRNRSSGSKSPSRMAGSENSAFLVSSTD